MNASKIAAIHIFMFSGTWATDAEYHLTAKFAVALHSWDLACDESAAISLASLKSLSERGVFTDDEISWYERTHAEDVATVKRERAEVVTLGYQLGLSESEIAAAMAVWADA